MRSFVVIALALLATPVSALEVAPPAEYASGPFLAPVSIHAMPRDFVEQTCLVHAPDDTGGTTGGASACVVMSNKDGPLAWEDRALGDRCEIFITEDLKHYDEILAHEEAHCRGWPADHPGMH